jgi:hypothetical protein
MSIDEHEDLSIVFPGRAEREPGIQMRIKNLFLDSGFRPSAGPGMTAFWSR